MAINRIIWGDEGANEFFAFDSLRGALLPKQQQVEVLRRSGFDGEQIRELGVWAKESKITTRAFVADLATHLADVEDYLALIDGLPYEIKQGGTSFGYYKIKDVQPAEPQPCVSINGAVRGGTPTILQIVQWIVISTDAPEA